MEPSSNIQRVGEYSKVQIERQNLVRELTNAELSLGSTSGGVIVKGGIYHVHATVLSVETKEEISATTEEDLGYLEIVVEFRIYGNPRQQTFVCKDKGELKEYADTKQKPICISGICGKR